MTDSVSAKSSRRNVAMPALLAGVILTIILGLGVALERANQGSISNGAAPDFTLTTDAGRAFKLSEQRGEVVVMNFWASWCGPCREEAPLLNSLWKDYREKGLELIGIGYLDNRSDARAFIAETGMSYPSAPDDGTVVSRLYRVRQVPETYLIDKQGQIALHLPGPLNTENVAEFRQILDRLLAATP